MTKHPADTLLRSLSAHAQKLIAEEARRQRQMQDPHGIAEELDKLAQAPYAEMFEGLARMLRSSFRASVHEAVSRELGELSDTAGGPVSFGASQVSPEELEILFFVAPADHVVVHVYETRIRVRGRGVVSIPHGLDELTVTIAQAAHLLATCVYQGMVLKRDFLEEAAEMATSNPEIWLDHNDIQRGIDLSQARLGDEENRGGER